MSLSRAFLRLFCLVISLAALPSPLLRAQPPDACPALIQQALLMTETTCAVTGRNQACYASILSEAIPRPDAPAFTFSAVGDLAPVGSIASLHLSGMNVERAEWGVVVLRVQANLPDTLPGQNVTFLLFGDVVLEDRAEPLVQQPLTAHTGVNLRAAPRSDGGLRGSYAAGAAFTATGRHVNAAGETWLRVRYEAERIETGWLIAGAVNASSADLSALPLVDADDFAFGPMQAFYFRSGIGQPACVEAPRDGVLIQTPRGVGRVLFSVNGVEMQLGSTAYLQAQPGRTLDVYLLEGEALLTHERVTQRLLPGMVSRVALDADGNADGPPAFPQPYDLAVVNPLLPPLGALPEPITRIAPPAQPPRATATPLPTVPGRPTLTPTLTLVGGTTGTPEATPVPGEPTPDPEPTREPCPLRNDQSATVLVSYLGQTAQRLRIFRTESDCREVQVGDLSEPGVRVQFISPVGATWIVRDDNGRERGRVQASEANGFYELIVR